MLVKDALYFLFFGYLKAFVGFYSYTAMKLFFPRLGIRFSLLYSAISGCEFLL